MDHLEGIAKNNLFYEDQPNREMLDNLVKYFFDGKKFKLKNMRNSTICTLSSMDGCHKIEFTFGYSVNFKNKIVRIIKIIENNKKIKEAMYIEGGSLTIDVYNENGSISYYYDSNHNKFDEFHFNLEGKLHSIMGPASISFFENDYKNIKRKYFINGEEINIPEDVRDNIQEYLKNYQILL